jgi:vacuolar-type H+-ATPase subunit I/STV1
MDRNKNFFDKIGSLIPGYSGYVERDGRRNCDKILREGITSQLNEIEKILYEKINEALKAKDKEQMKEIEELRKQINTFSSKVKYAPHGATAFFSDNQIKEDELYKIYQMDLDLAEATDNLHRNITELTLTDIKKMMVLNQSHYNKRNAYVNEFK